MVTFKRESQKSLTDLLLEAGIITENQLQRILELQAKEGDKIERVLLKQRVVTPQQLAFFTSLRLGTPYVNLKKVEVQPKAIALISESTARKYSVIPIDVIDGKIVVAMEDPTDIQALEELGAVTRKTIEPVLSTFQDIQETIDLNYRVSGEIAEQLSQIPTRYQRAGIREEARLSAEAIAQAPVVRAIDLLN